MNIFEKGLLRYLSTEQLNKIQSIKVGIGGAGGLGSNIANILVRSGFKNFEILDKDIIDPSNLNRQQYFIKDIKKAKVTTLKSSLLTINPDLHITIHNIHWNTNNAKHFFNDCDTIIEAFDNADSKHDFIEYYQDKTIYIVSGNGMAGISTQKAFEVKHIDNIYIVGDNTSNTEDGLPPMAPRVIMCASSMANVVLNKTLNCM